MDKIRIGIIGCGRIADLHAAAYRSCPHASIQAVCDTNPETAERRKREWKAAAAYRDYRKLLRDPAVDAVEILTPHTCHEEMVIAALKAGKHAALQKPMATDMASAKRIAEAASKSGRVFKVTENYIFYPPLQRARDLIRTGAIGAPQNIRINLIGAGNGGWEIPKEAWAWRMNELIESRGMETFDHGHHLWSTAWYLMGPFAEVAAWIDNTEGMVDAPAAVMWKHTAEKSYGSCHFSYCNNLTMPSDYYANDEWIDITGSNGILRINRCTGRLCEGPVLSLYTNAGWSHDTATPSDWQLGFTGALQNFTAAIRGDEAPHLSASEAVEIMAMNLAVQRACDRQRSVYIDEIAAGRGPLWARLRRRRNRKGIRRYKRGLLSEKQKGERRGGQGHRAPELTRRLPERAAPQALGDWQAIIGLNLQGEREGTGQFCLIFDRGTFRVSEERLPDNPDLVITVPPSVWAALLLGRKRLQTAFLQGTLKLEGDMDEAFKLKQVLGF